MSQAGFLVDGEKRELIHALPCPGYHLKLDSKSFNTLVSVGITSQEELTDIIESAANGTTPQAWTKAKGGFGSVETFRRWSATYWGKRLTEVWLPAYVEVQKLKLFPYECLWHFQLTLNPSFRCSPTWTSAPSHIRRRSHLEGDAERASTALHTVSALWRCNTYRVIAVLVVWLRNNYLGYELNV